MGRFQLELIHLYFPPMKIVDENYVKTFRYIQAELNNGVKNFSKETQLDNYGTTDLISYNLRIS